MAYWCDDQALNLEQRRLDAQSREAYRQFIDKINRTTDRDIAADERRCRWPECTCYSPQGPQECRRSLPAPHNLEKGE